jgi:uncharacterized Zn-binding protein involved in type VI secretion
MPAVQTDGDANDSGGTVSGGVASVRTNNKPTTVNGNPVTAHAPWKPDKAQKPHSAATTANGNGTVRAGGIPIVATGCADTCGHARAGGSGDVRAG